MRLAATIGLLLLVASGCEPQRSPSPPPVKTRGDAAGQEAVWTFTVVETKFARRRQMYFLSSSLNFRGSENKAIAIAAADFDAFRDADLDDLDAAYLGKNITARGALFEDEGQLLLRITSPDQIQLADEQAPKTN